MGGWEISCRLEMVVPSQEGREGRRKFLSSVSQASLPVAATDLTPKFKKRLTAVN